MNKQQTIQYLTDLMATIQGEYFKGRMEEHTLWVHERMDDSAAISIDLYNFGGDGKPVCEGLYPCTITHDDGTDEKGHVFCMCYDPDAVTPLMFLFSYAEWSDKSDIEIEPSVMPTQALQNVAAWLERAMQPMPKEKSVSHDVSCYWFYMWNKWTEEECKIVFKDDDYRHFWNKWCECYDRMGGPRGAAEIFYAELTDHNRDRIVARAIEVYDCENGSQPLTLNPKP